MTLLSRPWYLSTVLTSRVLKASPCSRLEMAFSCCRYGAMTPISDALHPAYETFQFTISFQALDKTFQCVSNNQWHVRTLSSRVTRACTKMASVWLLIPLFSTVSGAGTWGKVHYMMIRYEKKMQDSIIGKMRKSKALFTPPVALSLQHVTSLCTVKSLYC